ncbi:hypothetical protein CPB83DRAFT_889697 [Crepidotus variabilis]|uniref:Flavin-containing monooxygenase n=1 Tax=Crepidotus variabilis TaxID=179855 RepID=A0A9P6ES89_9AGAR|nr:hypothetical protein CPB83DRAFT_889697 [Crepidotus variabilis]
MAASYKPKDGPVVAIIGAGFGGVIAALYLEKKLGFRNFLIYEKDGHVGGTWSNNTYPGVHCDIISFLYSVSTDLSPDWNKICASQATVLSYIKSLIAKYNLDPHIHLNTLVIGAEWDDEKQIYRVETRDSNGTLRTQTANIIISAAGILHAPKMPNLSGLDVFKGDLFHSATWDHTVDLRNKRVAIIGNGTSAAQIMGQIPKIEGIQVTQFARTRSWILPYLQGNVPSTLQWVLRYVPFANRLLRWTSFWMAHELIYQLVFKRPALRGIAMKFSESRLKAAAPREYHDRIVPDFPVGSKRIIYMNDHLKVLHRSNADLCFDPIREIVADGLITSQGHVPFDVIICATGFISDKYMIPIRGKTGKTIQEYYDESGGANAYLGMVKPGFPNFAQLSGSLLMQFIGPNTATGFTSVVYFEEVEMDYICRLLKPLINGTVSSFEVKKEVNEAYNGRLQEKLSRSVHMGRSWYRTNGTGRNFAIWPGSGFAYWRRLRVLRWEDYVFRSPSGAIVKLNRASWWLGLTLAACIGTAACLAGSNMSLEALKTHDLKGILQKITAW